MGYYVVIVFIVDIVVVDGGVDDVFVVIISFIF